MKKLTKRYNNIVIQSFSYQNKGFDLLKDSLHLTDFYQKPMAYMQYATKPSCYSRSHLDQKKVWFERDVAAPNTLTSHETIQPDRA